MVMYEELIYQIALTLVPNIGSVQARILLEHFECAGDIFKAPIKKLETIEGIGHIRAKSITSFNGFARAEQEVAFIQKHQIQPLFFKNDNYPQRLKHCYDAPHLLFYKGNTLLNDARIISIVGTRSPTSYGEWATQNIITQLAPHNVMIVSGLAYGIDALAHKTALQQGLSTIGVLAHGLDRIYPTQHKSLAKDMLQQGGLLTDFMSGTQPDKQNFPKRNRIVAGLCDAVIVIETAAKGGSIITADLAFQYNRDVWAVPGRMNDVKSAGCLQLLKNQKAMPFISVDDMVVEMGWNTSVKINKQAMQRSLFTDASPEEQNIFNLLQEKASTHVDELFLRSGLSNSSIAATLLQLEFKGVIESLPGKRYKIML